MYHSLCAVSEAYWVRFEETHLRITDLRFEATEGNLQAIAAYLGKHSEWDGRFADGASVKTAHDLHQCEAAARSELLFNWTGVDMGACGKQGMISVVKWYSYHFTVRDVQKLAYRQDTLEFCDSSSARCFHADFHMTKTLPLGPREGGAWWYAGARTSVNILTVYVWGAKMDRGTYYTFLSDCLDHTPEYVVACLEHLWSILPNATVEVNKWWSDVGTHFRASRFWGYWLVAVPERSSTPATIDYFADGPSRIKQQCSACVFLRHECNVCIRFAQCGPRSCSRVGQAVS